MDWKLWCSSFIFVAVTALKLLFPEQTNQLREQVVTLIDMDMDYRPWVMEVGRLLSEESVYEVMGEVVERQDAIPNEYVVAHTFDAPIDDDRETNIDDEILRKIEAFQLSQEAYASYEVPANVSYAYDHLSFDYTAPVEGVCSSGFGYRVHPIDHAVSFHYGTDYEVNEGTPILAFADGIVTDVLEESGYGKYICIEHEDGWRTLYAHCSSVSVKTGQRIQMGDRIGESGQTGRVTGPHLHFELICDGVYTNPEFFLT